MAHYLQRLGLAALACLSGLAAAEAPRPFSHKLHLKLKPDCLACHASVATSRRVADNNLPAQEVCLGCHSRLAIKAPARTLLDRFDHQLHLKLGNVAPVIAAAIDSGRYLSAPGDVRRHLATKNRCVACHRGIEESEAVSNAVFPRMADCLVCHHKVDPPFSCELCHAPGPQLKPASHTGDWVDRHSSGKAKLDKESCAVCHGRRFTCQGCH